MVKIQMDTFVEKFQPEKYEKWLQGLDYGSHPEDPTRSSYCGKITRKKTSAAQQQAEKEQAATKKEGTEEKPDKILSFEVKPILIKGLKEEEAGSADEDYEDEEDPDEDVIEAYTDVYKKAGIPIDEEDEVDKEEDPDFDPSAEDDDDEEMIVRIREKKPPSSPSNKRKERKNKTPEKSATRVARTIEELKARLVQPAKFNPFGISAASPTMQKSPLTNLLQTNKDLVLSQVRVPPTNQNGRPKILKRPPTKPPREQNKKAPKKSNGGIPRPNVSSLFLSSCYSRVPTVGHTGNQGQRPILPKSLAVNQRPALPISSSHPQRLGLPSNPISSLHPQRQALPSNSSGQRQFLPPAGNCQRPILPKPSTPYSTQEALGWPSSGTLPISILPKVGGVAQAPTKLHPRPIQPKPMQNVNVTGNQDLLIRQVGPVDLSQRVHSQTPRAASSEVPPLDKISHPSPSASFPFYVTGRAQSLPHNSASPIPAILKCSFNKDLNISTVPGPGKPFLEPSNPPPTLQPTNGTHSQKRNHSPKGCPGKREKLSSPKKKIQQAQQPMSESALKYVEETLNNVVNFGGYPDTTIHIIPNPNKQKQPRVHANPPVPALLPYKPHPHNSQAQGTNCNSTIHIALLCFLLNQKLISSNSSSFSEAGGNSTGVNSFPQSQVTFYGEQSSGVPRSSLPSFYNSQYMAVNPDIVMPISEIGPASNGNVPFDDVTLNAVLGPPLIQPPPTILKPNAHTLTLHYGGEVE